MIQESASQVSLSRAHQLLLVSEAERMIFLSSLSPPEQRALFWDWEFWARPEQMEPPGDWSVWLVLAGRGYGKTRLGSEWVRRQVCGRTPLAPGMVSRIALVAETAADARDVMVEGVSGILACHPSDMRPKYQPSMRRLTWPNGAIATLFSAEDPEQLRGPEHQAAWSDELAKWRYAQETWDMLQFGLRTGDNPRQLVTTTPRPIAVLRELIAGEVSGETVVTRGSTYDNAANLSPKFLSKMRSRYEGTRLGRQELRAEILDDVPGALWTRDMFERRSAAYPLAAVMHPEEEVPELRRVVVGVDPSGTSGEQSDSHRREGKENEAGDDVGIVAAGIDDAGTVYVLEDATCNLGPAGWARHAIATLDRHMGDLLVAESNYGGAMVEHTLRSVYRSVPFKMVRASRGKVVRAQPIAALYEQGRVRHVGSMAMLEDQMCQMTATGYQGSRSPDRVDALVWAITECVFGSDGNASSADVQGHH